MKEKIKLKAKEEHILALERKNKKLKQKIKELEALLHAKVHNFTVKE